MATKDAVITLVGSLAAVRKIEIIADPKNPGAYKVAVFGETKTLDGKVIGLDVGLEDVPAGVAVLDNIWAHCLPVLRKANGLE